MNLIDTKRLKVVLDKHGGLHAVRSRLLQQDQALQAELESAGLSFKMIENLSREPSVDSTEQIFGALVIDVYVLLTQIRHHKKRSKKWVEEGFCRKLDTYRNGEDARMQKAGITFLQIKNELRAHPDRYKEIDNLLMVLEG